MILFKEIYMRAVNLFDDPDLRRNYVLNFVKFEKGMYPFLMNGVNSFQNPTKIAFLLMDQEEPSGDIESYEGNGEKTYPVTIDVKDNSDFYFTIDGKPDFGAVYNKEQNTVTFSHPVKNDSIATMESYFGGKFNTDFASAVTATAPANVIASRVKDILARATVLSWSEKERDNALDERNILTDTDFRIYSPANSIRAKTEWAAKLRFDLDTIQNKLSWDLLSRKYTGGDFYG